MFNTEISILSGQRKSIAKSTSSGTSKISMDHIHNVIEKLKSNQTRESTAITYHKVWRLFNAFLIRLDNSHSHTSWEERLVLFGTHLVDSGVQSSTIKLYFSAIKHVLRVDGYEWDDNIAMLSTITRSCKVLNDRVMIRMPIKRRLLEIILFEVTRVFKCDFSQRLYLALFSIAYYGLLRIGELTTGAHPIKARDVHIGSNKNKILLVLHSSKTHGKESRPQKIKIKAIEQGEHERNKFFCPFNLLSNYMEIRGDYLSETEPLFVFIDRSPVTPSHVRNSLKKILKNLNLQADLYNTHSFRAGRSTEMLMDFGYSLSEVMRAGRWRSTNAVMRYLKP